MFRVGSKAPSDPEAENRAAAAQVKTSVAQFAFTVVVLQLAPIVLRKLGVVAD